MPKTEKIRKSPIESATKFSIGYVKKGNDGNMWGKLLQLLRARIVGKR